MVTVSFPAIRASFGRGYYSNFGIGHFNFAESGHYYIAITGIYGAGIKHCTNKKHRLDFFPIYAFLL
jgi:hypothetical protein